MSNIIVTGDMHGEYDIYKFSSDYFNKNNYLELTKDDYVIVCGDFGLLWNYKGETKQERYWLDWLEDKPWTTLFVDGNHECFPRLNGYEIENWNGGNIHRIGESVIHLMRGQVFDLHGRKFFTMGGAPSHDIEYRTEGRSWWKEEVPSELERNEAMSNLSRYNWNVDYVVTHDAPSEIASYILSQWYEPDRDLNEYTDWLQDNICDNLNFKQWFFGHYHRDMKFNGNKFVCCYYDFHMVD